MLTTQEESVARNDGRLGGHFSVCNHNEIIAALVIPPILIQSVQHNISRNSSELATG